ncbi:hypothetical protein HK100_010900 [Physocladia obscura]|uniref:Uncharacterized protein n=1 Tax=Physocladia obscura TaxID=109957 RepID=A0AAD5T4M6_9FUNG|nr:hypothetical protein HK100_010900 [Physocladia obscura]
MQHASTHKRAFGLSLNSTLMIWDFDTEQMIKTISSDPADDDMLLSGNAVASADGRFVAFGIRGIRVLSAETLTIIWTKKLHQIDPLLSLHGISHIRFMDGNTRLVIVSDKGDKINSLKRNVAGEMFEWRTIIQQFEISTENGALCTWTVETPVHAMAVVEDQRFIAVGGRTGLVEVYNLRDGSQIISESVTHSISSLSYTQVCKVVAENITVAQPPGMGH